MHIARIVLVSFFAAACSIGSVKSVAAAPSQKQADTVLRGIYLHNGHAQNQSRIEGYVRQGKPLGLNMFVLDAQSYNGQRAIISTNIIKYLRQEGMYTAIRVVCFQDGLKTLPIPQWQLHNLYAIVEASAASGADEVQLDYIRFEDSWSGISIEQKAAAIDTLLGSLRKITEPHGVKLSADVFGRIPYNRRDPVGQSIEGFAKHVDVIYPMMYPSHFTADQRRLSQPGFTVREGTELALQRLQGTGVTVQPYIQSFVYNIGWARVPLVRYIELQMEGAEAAAGRGWVAWNAGGDYGELWQAMGNIQKRAQEVGSN
ncbi:MAG: putative glycoside hydrolase [Spirochaetota bacterium]|jgi:hypothetical protein|nr:putative glycoside hydrolase [Spirochaetota bacterium]